MNGQNRSAKGRGVATAIGLLMIAAILGAQQAAMAGSIPLPKGQYSQTVSGSIALCLNPTTFAEEACNTTGVLVVPLTALSTGIVGYDKNANSCVTVVEVDANSPVDASPPFVTTDEHAVGTLKHYDSSTGVGDVLFTGYTGGSCNGASFDSTGATEISSGTSHFVVSEQGKRIDFLITSLTNPSNALGDFSLSGVSRAQ